MSRSLCVSVCPSLCRAIFLNPVLCVLHPGSCTLYHCPTPTHSLPHTCRSWPQWGKVLSEVVAESLPSDWSTPEASGKPSRGILGVPLVCRPSMRELSASSAALNPFSTPTHPSPLSPPRCMGVQVVVCCKADGAAGRGLTGPSGSSGFNAALQLQDVLQAYLRLFCLKRKLLASRSWSRTAWTMLLDRRKPRC